MSRFFATMASDHAYSFASDYEPARAEVTPVNESEPAMELATDAPVLASGSVMPTRRSLGENCTRPLSTRVCWKPAKRSGEKCPHFPPSYYLVQLPDWPGFRMFRDLPVLPSPEIALVRSPVSWTLRLRCGNWHQDGANGLQGSVQTFSVQQQPLPGRYQLPGQARLVSEQ